MFDFDKAQKYEMIWQYGYIKDHLEPAYRQWLRDKELNLTPLTWWVTDVEAFLSHIKGGVGIEVGCGSIPDLKHPHGLKRRIVIDPLARKYKLVQRRMWGGSFFDDLEVIADPVEKFRTDLYDSADVIIYRNSLDHTDDPLVALRTIAQYASTGCYFLFWTDIWHNYPPDAGHRNITKDANIIHDYLLSLGWRRVNGIGPQHDNTTDHIEIGGVWRMI